MSTVWTARTVSRSLRTNISDVHWPCLLNMFTASGQILHMFSGPAYLACLLSHGHLTVTVLHEKLSISLIKTALRYSAPEYCAQLWSRFAHTSQFDVQLNSTMRLISGTLRSTPLP